MPGEKERWHLGVGGHHWHCEKSRLRATIGEIMALRQTSGAGAQLSHTYSYCADRTCGAQWMSVERLKCIPHAQCRRILHHASRSTEIFRAAFYLRYATASRSIKL